MSEPALRLRALWHALGWGFVGLVVWLSLMQKPPAVDIPLAFDAGHVFAYGWLMLWFAQLQRATAARWAIAAGLFALGALLEVLQGLTPHRMFDYFDMAANAAGIVLGLALARTALQNALLALEGSLALR